jgi:TRAP-type mannitol/chloroaromatic compound transport system permease small subunit
MSHRLPYRNVLVEEILRVSFLWLPFLLLLIYVGGEKITLSTARKILKAHLGNGIDIDAKSLSNVIAAVSKYIKFIGIGSGYKR